MERGKKNSIVPINFYCNQPTIIAGITGIGPNSSGPIPPLIGLTREQAKGAVLSNYFVVPHVTINTIIWQNWDIFRRLKYCWKVVRSRPENVKLFLDDGRCFMCEPNPNKLVSYSALFFTKRGSHKTLLSSGTLGEAIQKCEHKLDSILQKGKNANMASCIQTEADEDLLYDDLKGPTSETLYRIFENLSEEEKAFVREVERVSNLLLPAEITKNRKLDDYCDKVVDQLNSKQWPSLEDELYILESFWTHPNRGYAADDVINYLDIYSEREAQKVFYAYFNGFMGVAPKGQLAILPYPPKQLSEEEIKAKIQELRGKIMERMKKAQKRSVSKKSISSSDTPDDDDFDKFWDGVLEEIE